MRYFDPEGDRWQLKPALRRMVQFRTVNLLDDLAPLGRFDAIFCRNVLIYFDAATKASILERIARSCRRTGSSASAAPRRRSA